MALLDKLASQPRVRVRRPGPPDPAGSCVVYWMQRSQRALDNPALDLAVAAANALSKPVVAYFAPVPFYPHANLRPYQFLVEGIPDIASALAKRNIGFVLRRYPDHSLLKFCAEVRPALVVGDENPMREPEHWRQLAAQKLAVPFWTVDSDVIVPSRLIEKEQYAAFHIRRKLHLYLDRFLVKPTNPRAKIAWRTPRGLQSLSADFGVLDGWPLDRSVSPVSTYKGGTTEALRLLREFVRKKLKNYEKDRNHPELDGTSRLSPYLHFGHISPLTVALAVRDKLAAESSAGTTKSSPRIRNSHRTGNCPRTRNCHPEQSEGSAFPSFSTAAESFLNELLVWRELAINFVIYNPNYDNFASAEPWARRTLAEHAADPRPYLYSERQLENAETHDPLWNAAQRQMVQTGWMHNTMRMYWGKKILEWTASPAEAYATAVALNDRYQLDGRDPNGYAGVAWSIAGKFDRPWFTRPVFGQIRYMSGSSTGKKFDSRRYIEQQSQQHAAGTPK